VTDNGDGTLTILVLGTGNFTVNGEDGKAIARSPGQLRFELLIDHAGIRMTRSTTSSSTSSASSRARPAETTTFVKPPSQH